MLITFSIVIYAISRPHGGLRSSSWALWARDGQYVGRDNIISIPYGSIYRATTVTNVTYELRGVTDIENPYIGQYDKFLETYWY